MCPVFSMICLRSVCYICTYIVKRELKMLVLITRELYYLTGRVNIKTNDACINKLNIFDPTFDSYMSIKLSQSHGFL